MINSDSSDQYHTIFLLIKSRLATVFEGQVKSVTSFNRHGTFDVLPQHSHFISIIEKFITVHQLDGQDQTFKLTTGVMHIEQNTIKVYLDQ